MAYLGHYSTDEFDAEFGREFSHMREWWITNRHYKTFLHQVLPHCTLTMDEQERFAKAQLAAETFHQKPNDYANWGHVALAVVLSRRLPDELTAFKARLMLLGEE